MKKQETHNDEDLKKLAPLLFSLKKENPYKVPNGYFDELPSIIQEKIIEDILVPDSLWARISKAIFRPQFAWSSLSIATLIFIGGLVFKSEYKPEQISSQDIAEVIYHQEIDNMNETDLIDAMPEEKVNTIKTETNSKEHEAIMEYLLDNKIEEAEIVDQLNAI